MESRRRWLRRSVVVIGLGLMAAAGSAMFQSGVESPTPRRPGRARPTAATRGAARHSVQLGRSVRHRPIEALEVRGAGADRRRPALVVGAIHGDETAGIRVARALALARPLPGVDLWIVFDLNPDGAAASKRQNARRVDLNRNFPWLWRLHGRPGDPQYPGPRALSEPEARIAQRLILRIRPRVTIWFHQPLAATDLSGGDPAVERRFAAISRLPLRRLPRYPGSAATWENHRLPGTTAFVVELPAGQPTERATTRYARAVRATLTGRAGG